MTPACPGQVNHEVGQVKLHVPARGAGRNFQAIVYIPSRKKGNVTENGFYN